MWSVYTLRWRLHELSLIKIYRFVFCLFVCFKRWLLKGSAGKTERIIRFRFTATPVVWIYFYQTAVISRIPFINKTFIHSQVFFHIWFCTKLLIMAYDNNVYKDKIEDYKIAPSKVIRKIFACGNRNPGILESSTWYPGSTAWNPASLKDCLRFSYMRGEKAYSLA